MTPIVAVAIAVLASALVPLELFRRTERRYQNAPTFSLGGEPAATPAGPVGRHDHAHPVVSAAHAP